VRVALTLQSELVARLEHDGVLDQLARRLTEQDLARAGGFLQPLRDVDGVARRKHLSAGAVPGDHLAGVDPDTDADVHAEVAPELVVQLGERLPELGAGADCAQRVVLVQLGDAEDGHDRVPDELLDRAAVPLEHAGHPFEPTRHDAPQRLRVEPLAERRRIRNVREEDGDRTATDGHVPECRTVAEERLGERLLAQLGQVPCLVRVPVKGQGPKALVRLRQERVVVSGDAERADGERLHI
jgi:hypothetical protein